MFEITVLTTSFGDIAYEDSGHGESSILMLHGGASNLRCWDDIVEKLNPSHRCIVLDLPGHGQTTAEPLMFPQLGDAIIEVLGTLKVQKPFVVGHSYGGLIGASFSVQYPDYLTGLMAIDPYLDSKEIRRKFGSVDEALSGLISMEWPWRPTKDLDVEVERCLREQYSPRRNPGVLRSMIRRGYREQVDGTFVRYPRKEEEMAGIRNNWSVDVGLTFASLQCPVSIVTSHDPAWNLVKRRENLLLLSQSLTEFETTEFDCGHDIPGYEPNELCEYLIGWLARIQS